MKPPCTPSFYRINDCLAATLGLTLNAILVVLIVLRTPNELRVYSRVLLCGCCFEMLFALNAFFIGEHISYHSGMLFGVASGYGGSSHEGNFALAMTYVQSTYTTLTMTAVPQVYRYLVICRDRKMSTKQLVGLVLCAQLLAAACPLSAVFTWLPNGRHLASEYADVIAELPCHDPGQFPFFFMHQVASLRIAMPLIIAMLDVTATYTLVVICSYKVWAQVRRELSNQQATSVQRQLNYALAVQAIIPLCVLAIPLAMALGVMLTASESLAFVLPAVTSVASWIPVLNPIATVFFIRTYRASIVRTLRLFVNGVAPNPQPFHAIRPVSETHLPMA